MIWNIFIFNTIKRLISASEEQNSHCSSNSYTLHLNASDLESKVIGCSSQYSPSSLSLNQLSMTSEDEKFKSAPGEIITRDVGLKAARRARLTNVRLFEGKLSRCGNGTNYNSESLDWSEVDCFVTIAHTGAGIDAWKTGDGLRSKSNAQCFIQ